MYSTRRLQESKYPNMRQEYLPSGPRAMVEAKFSLVVYPLYKQLEVPSTTVEEAHGVLTHVLVKLRFTSLI